MIAPILGVALGVNRLIDDRTAGEIQRLRELLATGCQEARHANSPSIGLQRLQCELVWRLQHGGDPRAFVRYADAVEKCHPGLLQWLVWDRHGQILTGSSSAHLPPSRFWKTVAGSFMERMGNPARPSANPEAMRRAREQFLMFSGQRLRLEGLAAAPGHVLQLAWLGAESVIIWAAVPRPVVARGPFVGGGFLLLLNVEKSPPGLWLARTVRRTPWAPHELHGLTAVAFELGRQARGHVGDPELRATSIVKNTRRGYLNRTEDYFNVGPHLALAAYTEREVPWRLVLLGDRETIERKARDRRHCAAIVLLFVFFTLLVAARLPSVRNLPARSLRWRISGLFVAAVLLPVTGLYLFGSVMAANLAKQRRNECIEQMRRQIDIQALRFDESRATLEGLLQRRITRACRQARGDVNSVLRALDTMARDGLINFYFLSDSSGRTAVATGSALQDQASANALRVIISASLQDFMGQLRPQHDNLSALRGMVRDEVSTAFAQDSRAVMQVGLLRGISTGKHMVYVMRSAVPLGKELRVVALGTTQPDLESFYLRAEFREFARRQRQRLGEPAVEMFATNMDGRSLRRFPPGPNPVWKALGVELNNARYLKMRFEGERVIAGEPFVYLVTRLPNMTNFVFAILTSLTPINNEIRRTEQFVVAIVAVTALLALILGLAVTNSLVEPIRILDLAVTHVGAGNLEVTVPPLGEDELGRLSTTFNAMVQGMRERERMRAYVSETVLEAVQDDKAAARGRRGQIEEATVLFSDVRGFTTLAERHPPEAMFAMLNAFLGGIEPIIRYHRGRIDKFIGDAVMAVFLAPAPDQPPADDHPLRAVRVGMAMRRFVGLFNRKRERAGDFAIDIGVGISTGPMLLGDVGSKRRKDLTVIGDEVNLASRLETASKQGRHTRIIVSETTWTRVQSEFAAEEMALAEVKGKTQRVRMFEILGPRS